MHLKKKTTYYLPDQVYDNHLNVTHRPYIKFVPK